MNDHGQVLRSPAGGGGLSPFLACAWVLLAAASATAATPGEPSARDVIDQAQAKMVKIYGAGGFRSLEGYQSGMLISAQGHILTVLSHVLDTDYISVTLCDGRRFEAKLLGADPRAGRGGAEDRGRRPAPLRAARARWRSPAAPACWR